MHIYIYISIIYTLNICNFDLSYNIFLCVVYIKYTLIFIYEKTITLFKKKKKFIHHNLFFLFEKSNFLRKYHLLSCLPSKNVYVYKITFK